MNVALGIFGVALAAFCVWLTVRVVNRRERWAKWTAAALVLVLVGYPLSAGPFIRLHYKMGRPAWLKQVGDTFYSPLIFVIERSPTAIAVRFLDYQKWWIDVSDLGLPR